MKPIIPFPYWLWEEIVLTHPPHNKHTLFRLVSVVAAVVFAASGYFAGRSLWGIWAGILLAIPLALIGLTTGYLMLRCTEFTLRFLVRKGIIAEPDFPHDFFF